MGRKRKDSKDRNGSPVESGNVITTDALFNFVKESEERNQLFFERVMLTMNQNVERTMTILNNNIVSKIDKVQNDLKIATEQGIPKMYDNVCEKPVDKIELFTEQSNETESDQANRQSTVHDGKPYSVPPLVQSHSFITSFKDLGGNSVIFSPNGSLHPVAFIRKLKELFESAGVPAERQVNLAINGLRGSAAVWAEVKRDDFRDFATFKKFFLARYWNSDKEREAYQKLHFGVYHEGESKADYFMRMVKEARYLSNKVSERDIVKLLINHFPNDIKRGILNSGLKTVDEIDEHLRTIDDTYGENERRGVNVERGWRRVGANNGGYQGNHYRSGRNDANQAQRRDVVVEERPPQQVNVIEPTQLPIQGCGNTNQVMSAFFGSDGTDLLGERVENELTKVKEMPIVSGKLEGVETQILIDSGSQVSCISREFFDLLQQSNNQIPLLPVSSTTIVGAIGRKGQKVTEQVYLHVRLGIIEFDYVFLVVPSLVRSAILGCDWLTEFEIRLDFSAGVFSGRFGNNRVEFRLVSCKVPAAGLQVSHIETEECKPSRLTAKAINYDTDAIKKIAYESEMCNEECRKNLFQLLLKYRGIFSNRPGRMVGYMHEMKMKDETPFHLKSYPVPHRFRKEVDRQVQEMEEWGVISRGQTEFVSPLVVVQKKDGTPRVCLDARQLNKRLEHDHVVPPCPNELLFNFSNDQCLSTIDLTASYWQVPIVKSHRKFTGFSYAGETYMFNVLPFGLTTSVGSFIRGLNRILGPEVSEFVVPYVDDLLIFSRDPETHLKHLQIIFEKFRQSKITVKLSKCLFLRKQVKFLGHIITPSSIEMDPARITAVQDFRRPRNIKDLRAFLGLVNYDRRFVDHFSDLVHGLSDLLKKGSKWKWGSEEQKVFERIKRAFVKVMKLSHPDLKVPFFINTDASYYAIGACLYQKDDTRGVNVIAYYSRSLRVPELNYTVTEKEALSLVAALKQWRVFVLGHSLIISTDHKALTFLKSCRLLNSRLTRWILYIQEFDFAIQYCKGANNQVSDILSRYPNDSCEGSSFGPAHTTVEISAIRINELDKAVQNNLKDLKKAQTLDRFCKKVREELEKEHGNPRYRLWFYLHEGIIFKRGSDKDPYPKICVPKSHVLSLVQREHINNGHFGVAKCTLALLRFYYWPKMREHIRKLVTSCDLCQKSKISRRCRGKFQAVTPSTINELVCVDLMGPLPQSRGGATQLLVAMDAFSKLVRLYPLRRATGKAIVRCLVGKYFAELGAPNKILSDNGPQFCSKVFCEGMKDRGIQIIHTSQYYPQGNQVERANREIGRLLRAYCHASHVKWACVLREIQVCLNRAIHDSTGLSPNEIHFSSCYEDPLLVKVDFGNDKASKREFIVLARERLRSKAERRKDRFRAESGRMRVFKPGDQVLVREHKLSSAENREIKKFFLLYRGPCTVVSCVYPNVYTVRENDTDVDLGLQNVFNLKAYKVPVVNIE